MFGSDAAQTTKSHFIVEILLTFFVVLSHKIVENFNVLNFILPFFCVITLLAIFVLYTCGQPGLDKSLHYFVFRDLICLL